MLDIKSEHVNNTDILVYWDQNTRPDFDICSVKKEWGDSFEPKVSVRMEKWLQMYISFKLTLVQGIMHQMATFMFNIVHNSFTDKVKKINLFC